MGTCACKPVTCKVTHTPPQKSTPLINKMLGAMCRECLERPLPPAWQIKCSSSGSPALSSTSPHWTVCLLSDVINQGTNNGLGRSRKQLKWRISFFIKLRRLVSDVMQFPRDHRKDFFLDINKKVMHQWKCSLERVPRVSIGGVFTAEGKWNSSYEESGPLCHCRRLPDQACHWWFCTNKKQWRGVGEEYEISVINAIL